MKGKILVAMCTAMFAQSSLAETSFTDALTGGKPSVNMNLRYETVEQDNALKDATAMTLRTRIGYTTGSFYDFSALVEMADNHIVGGFDEYTVGPTGFNPGQYSVIADPEYTELDQAFIQYKTDAVAARLGRQVIIYDNSRFVGNVGWRQDQQTFDALKFDYTASKALSVSYSYLYKRNRIFADAADVDSKDSLLNVGFDTGVGKLVAYAYLLEVDNNTDNALDTYGVSFAGKLESGFKYRVEYATQTAESGAAEADADYIALQGSSTFADVSATLGYEMLGSDSGNYGFSTPLATLHKFNGWADVFLSTPDQGLVDVYVSASTKVAGAKATLVYHDFSADQSSAGVDDLGSEIDFALVKKFDKIYTAGIKYASYSAGDVNVDTDKLWIWLGAAF